MVLSKRFFIGLLVLSLLTFYMPQNIHAEERTVRADTSQSKPEIWTAPELEIPVEEKKRSWLSRNKWWVILGTLVVAGGTVALIAAGDDDDDGPGPPDPRGSYFASW